MKKIQLPRITKQQKEFLDLYKPFTKLKNNEDPKSRIRYIDSNTNTKMSSVAIKIYNDKSIPLKEFVIVDANMANFLSQYMILKTENCYELIIKLDEKEKNKYVNKLKRIDLYKAVLLIKTMKTKHFPIFLNGKMNDFRKSNIIPFNKYHDKKASPLIKSLSYKQKVFFNKHNPFIGATSSFYNYFARSFDNSNIGKDKYGEYYKIYFSNKDDDWFKVNKENYKLMHLYKWRKQKNIKFIGNKAHLTNKNGSTSIILMSGLPYTYYKTTNDINNQRRISILSFIFPNETTSKKFNRKYSIQHINGDMLDFRKSNLKIKYE